MKRQVGKCVSPCDWLISLRIVRSVGLSFERELDIRWVVAMGDKGNGCGDNNCSSPERGRDMKMWAQAVQGLQ